ncbi:MAG: PAS domain S-box protein, partial [Bacteroidales bacterium]|nr:PAS domain S-box protein [Bacteroidales bacterium]
MYRNISLAYQSLDTNGYILDVNPSWLKVLGYKEADVLGTRFRDYLHPDHVLMFERNFETLKQNGSSQDLVVKLRKQNGSYIFAAFEGVIEYDSHRKPIRTHSVFKDITIQKTLEQELSSQSERLKMAIEASQTGIWDWNFKEKRIYLDNRSYNMAGYVESDFQNFLSEFRKRIHPEELTKVQNEILKHLKGRSKTFDVEYRILKKNGAWMWISTHGKVTSRDSNGKPLRLSGTNTDIDFRKISELKIRESEQNLFDLVENMQDGVAIANENGHHIYVNKAFCKMTGYTQKELLNITGWELTLEKDIPILKERMSKRMQGQPIQSKYDRTIKRKDGATIKVEMSTTMTIWKGKKCPMVIVHDITEREETLNKIQFLVSLLRSVREINHRIVTETNFNDLIKSTCDILLQNQDYLYVEISLSSDDTDTITPYVSSGIMALCNWKHSRTNSSAPKCIREGVKLNKTIAVVDPEKYCINCQYYDADLPHETIVTPISRKNRIIGFIKTSLKSEHNITDEEIALLEEIAGDLAFAEEKFKSDLLLIESENRFKTMINRLVDAVFITDFDSNIIQANPAAVEQTGYTLDELKGIKMLQTLSPGYSDERKENIINSLKNNETVYFEEKKIRKNGDEYWTECTLNLINLKGKDLVLSVNREITEKKKTEDRLRQLSYVVEQNPASIVITDLNGTIEYINPKFTDLTGYFPEEAIGENPRVVKSGKMDQSIYKELWETITNGETWKGELLNRKKNGELFWELASISPLKNEADEITHYVGVKEDITKRKKHENTQKILLEISQSYNIQNTLFSFIKDVHQKIKEVVRADNFYVALYNSDDNTFSFPYHVDEFDQLELDKPYDFSNGYTDFVFKS